ncbi:hypothetical protein [Pseudomonas leptonychotis]|uniref:Uncharacterized protein n=1 Tax=Pseudomonas leptonychotis TaxID=2448482 RepID=A0A4T2A4T3_9PSED|nr:hypothetical protein [Pseudomonas leptonychotis]TIH10818.1 hypothetical protein D8779_09120 [Pseudomonas leptonychotis]
MSTGVLEAVVDQPSGMVAQPMMECVTPEERLLLRFYRQLGEVEQVFMRRAIEAMVLRESPS